MDDDLADGQAIVEVHPPSWRDDYVAHLYWIDTSGEILRHEAVPLRTGLSANPVRDWWGLLLMFPEPFAASVVATVATPQRYMDRGEEDSYLEALDRSIRTMCPAFLPMCLVSAAAAWFCYRRQRRYFASQTWLWVAFVFLGGIPALLAYLAHRRWPARLPCASCQNASPRDRPSCAVCGTEFPEPERAGTEVELFQR